MLYRIRAEGVENVPSDGGVMVASNHASMLDPPCVGVCIPREITYFAKKELFSIPGFGQFIAAVNSLPVDRRGFSRSALKEIIDRLKAGWAVLIFPEGTRTRTGDFLEPKSGAGMIAVTADTLIVPCWVEGSYRAKPFFSRITVHFLPPFKPSEIVAETKKDHYLLVSKRIMYDITNLYKTHMAVRNEAKSKEQ
ncbi:1-acyl-sn-glycerol-3-phosphate acyltransferase [bacterium]|nr:1-acyl-sn-glycerol-3-phosphate acyltransferase [bacterium]